MNEADVREAILNVQRSLLLIFCFKKKIETRMWKGHVLEEVSMLNLAQAF